MDTEPKPPEPIIIENKSYFLCDDLNNYDTNYFSGMHRNLRGIIKKKNIPETAVKYAYYKNNQLVISTESYVRSKLYLEAEWVDSNIPKMMQLNNQITTNTNNNDQLIDNNTEINNISKVPSLLKLNDNEKFKDDNGNVLQIEVRGERLHNKCFFRVKDVMDGFKMNNLNTTLLHEAGYKKGIHYTYFIIKKLLNKQQIVSKKEMYLTYNGMLKVLFSSRSGNAEQFQNWASEILFTAQMGTDEQKNKLVSSIKGVSYESIQEIFSIHARTLPCVYLVAFDTVDKLRNIMNINDNYPNDAIVYKFGLTKNFEDRKNGHKTEYKELKNIVEMVFVCYTFIDPLYLREAENELKESLNDYKIKYKDHDELIILPKDIFKFVKNIYENIGMKYSGHTSELNKQINDIEKELQKERFEKEIQKERYEKELLLKEIEILKLKANIKQ